MNTTEVILYRTDLYTSSNLGALCEPISCILHGYKRIENKIRPNKKVLIVGAGIIGNLWATLLHYKGVRNIIVSEFSEARRRITDKLGMSLSIIYRIIIKRRIIHFSF